mgnify:CR=1 FL=1
MKQEPIASLDLMERASGRFAQAFMREYPYERPVVIVAGSGNNGGDGLVAARKLHQNGYAVTVLRLELGTLSPDCAHNWERLQAVLPSAKRLALAQGDALPEFPGDTVLIDAIFGSGLNRPVAGWPAQILASMNDHKGTRIALDIPSGLFADALPPEGAQVFHAHHTFTLHLPKQSFFWKETDVFTGRWTIVDIGLNDECIAARESPFHALDQHDAAMRYRPRRRFSHKGHFGHALLVGGAPGKAGALVMAAYACLRSGAGLTTACTSGAGAAALGQFPEVMLTPTEAQTSVPVLPEDLGPFNVVGIGPGLGQHAEARKLLHQLLGRFSQPLVLDADALNLLAQQPDLLGELPEHSILTPHPGEWRRLLGGKLPEKTPEAIEAIREFARQYQCICLYKVAHTAVITPQGEVHLNNSGNPGMATGGMGDVLCGIITALLAQHYRPVDAACLGVWLHGHAADMAMSQESYESLLPCDVVQYLGRAFKSIQPAAH